MDNHGVRKLLILLAVLLVLVVAVVGLDIGGRAFAESKAGETIATQTGTTAPDVTIHGFSFLAQAVPGHYSQITVHSTGLRIGPLTGIAATVELYDVDFPLSDATKGDTSRLVAGSATVNGMLAATEVTRAIGRPGTSISAGPNGAIRLSSTVSVAGRDIPVTGDLVASFDAGVLHLNATDLRAAGIALPNTADLTKDFSLTLPLTGLPLQVDAATLTSSGTDLLLTANATNVRLGAIG